MVHLNGNLIVAIDTETTGLDRDKHEIIEIAALPLNSQLEPHKGILPFEMTMKPMKNIEDIDMKALGVNRQRLTKIMTNSLTPDRVADLFIRWYEKLNLGSNRRLSPLAHNWVFDCPFIRDWLGPATFDLIFDGRFRDVMSTANFINDRAEFMGAIRIPYPKVKLTYLASQMNIDHSDAHNALPDCRITAAVYKRLVQDAL
jgi:DNA polymerase III epsilon subunit-like protein